MYLLIIFFPLISSIFTGLFGKKFGSQGSVILSIICLILSFVCSFFAFYEVGLMQCCVYIKLFAWIDCENLNIDWGFLYDSLTVVMCCTVTFISLFVHLYSIEYMVHDPHLLRFMCYLSLFTFFMIVLVTSDNFIQMFFGWEGIGVCSFLLINFWYNRIQANKAAIKAMLINRIGDFGLIIGIIIIFTKFKAVDYATIFALIPLFNSDTISVLSYDFKILNIIGFFLFIGAIGKSAQLGLHTWLPDAMEGPTPVSALIHAATLVTAGVFLIARCSPIYEYAVSILDIIAIFGAMTAFFGSTIGLMQNDLKKVIAYSTCSQLGYMVFACGLSNYSIGIFHLINHAFFKGLLFLGAGSVIHAVADEQDMRKMGGLRFLIPFTYSVMVIGSLALIGFPFLTGFYSKDLILELAYSKFSTTSHFSYYLGTFGVFFTAFYSTRLVYLTFLSKPNGYKLVICNAQDPFYQIGIALSCLAIPSIFIGYYLKDLIAGFGCSFWGSAIFVHSKNLNLFDCEFIGYSYKILPVFLTVLGVILAFLLYSFKNIIIFKIKTCYLGNKIYNFLNKKWYFDKIYNQQIGQFLFQTGYSTSYKIIDRGIFEILGPNGLVIVLEKISIHIIKLQSNHVYHYLFLMLVGCTGLIVCLQFLTELIINSKLLLIFFSLLFF